jgi:hypothetical protein
MRVIDTHMHLGECRVFGLNISEKDLLSYIEKYNVSVIVQPFPGSPDPIKTHDKIYELSIRHKGKIYGLVSINPFLNEELLLKEFERTFKELKFVGLKLHTVGHSISPMNPRAILLFEVAKKYKVPLMIHTGPGPFSDPALVIPRAEEYPDVKIILAHAGFGIYANTALWLAKKYDNIYLETSWSYIYDLQAFLNAVPDKIVFGTDLIENIPVEYAKIDALHLSDEIREKWLYLNAKKLFNLSE